MLINIIAVGKLKEKYLTDAFLEYAKRIKRFCKFNLIELKDMHVGSNFSDKDIENVKELEGQKILDKIKKDDYVILLEVDAKQLTSVEFAKKIESITTYNNSTITFVIGGSCGNGSNVKKRSNFQISFSKLTFPHQLIRINLVEQIFRCFKINNNESYHK